MPNSGAALHALEVNPRLSQSLIIVALDASSCVLAQSLVGLVLPPSQPGSHLVIFEAGATLFHHVW
jgi:hypothetical protein